jgi:hypothetical protein
VLAGVQLSVDNGLFVRVTGGGALELERDRDRVGDGNDFLAMEVGVTLLVAGVDAGCLDGHGVGASRGS